MNAPRLLLLPLSAALLAACGAEDVPPVETGPDPALPDIERGLLPSMVIAEPAEWGDRMPVVPEGYAVSAFATGL